MRKTGRVLKFYSNELIIEDILGGQQYRAKLRGKFKKQNIRPIVGDLVEYTVQYNEAVVENIIHRKNDLPKPRVANIDQIILVTCLYKPSVPYDIVDRFIALSEYQNIDIVIVVNKIDLIEEKEKMEEFKEIYGKLYPLLFMSAFTKEGIDKFIKTLKGKVSVFAGMSGVGKSSLVNSIDPNIKLRTGEISEKLDRGRHTTTTAELLRLSFGGWVVDTPGFASLEIDHIPKDELKNLYIELRNTSCFFADCNHIDEPGCQVKEKIEKGEISFSRYESYLKFYQELLELEAERFAKKRK